MRLFIALFFTVAAAAAQTLDFTTESPGAVQVNQYLTRRKSPMTGLGSELVTNGREYNVDPRLLVAIAGAETSFGRRLCAAHNSWNWFHRGSCPPSTFPSFSDGAKTVTRFLRLSYLNKGYTTISRIRYKYCATGCEHWIPNVTTFYAEMPANGSTSSRETERPIEPKPEPKPEPRKVVEPEREPEKPATVTSTVADSSPSPGLEVPPWIVGVLGVLALGAWATSGRKQK